MAANAGEKAQMTGDFKCDHCGASVHVPKGKTIPICSSCGNASFSVRQNEPGNPSTSQRKTKAPRKPTTTPHTR